MALIIAKTVLSIFLLSCLGFLLFLFIKEPVGTFFVFGFFGAFALLMWSAVVVGEHWNDSE